MSQTVVFALNEHLYWRCHRIGPSFCSMHCSPWIFSKEHLPSSRHYRLVGWTNETLDGDYQHSSTIVSQMFRMHEPWVWFCIPKFLGISTRKKKLIVACFVFLFFIFVVFCFLFHFCLNFFGPTTPKCSKINEFFFDLFWLILTYVWLIFTYFWLILTYFDLCWLKI